MNKKENNKAIPVLITEFDFDISEFYRKRYKNLIFILLSFILGYPAIIIGYILFIKMIRKRKRLFELKQGINIRLTELIGQISIEEYLELKSRLINAGRQKSKD